MKKKLICIALAASMLMAAPIMPITASAADNVPLAASGQTAELSNTSTCSSTITLGDTINISGKATGGTAPYTYEYYFKPGAAVPYNVKVVVTDSKGKTATKTFNVAVNAALSNTSTCSSTITLGDTINISGKATGGTAPYTYEYYFKQASQTAWSKKSVSNTTTSTTVKPGAAVPYNVKVVVKDSAGKSVEKTFNVSVNAALANTSTCSSTITLGDTINISGKATGGTAPYKYEYYFKQASQSEWTQKSVSNTTTSTTVKPGAAVPYNVKVVVTDSKGKTATKTFNVAVNAALANTSTCSSTITLGDTINISGKATGGTAPYKYTYYYKKAASDDWTLKSVSATTTSTTVSPEVTGAYNVKVVVTDSAGKTAEKTFDVTVIEALDNMSACSSIIAVDDTINISGAASGGTAPYKYSYYYKKASESSWTTKLSNTTATSTTVTPAAAVPYNVKVVVIDSAGRTEEKIFDVTVNAALSNTSTCSSTITLGDSINISGKATGGTAPYKYSYYYKKASESSWATKLSNTTETTTSFEPEEAGTYNVKVVVTDSRGRHSMLRSLRRLIICRHAQARSHSAIRSTFPAQLPAVQLRTSILITTRKLPKAVGQPSFRTPQKLQHLLNRKKQVRIM